MTKAVVEVCCKVCGDMTRFVDGTPDNDHIVITAPNKYRCISCDNFTDCGMELPFVIRNYNIP